MSGEWWRLWTGHAVHYSAAHLFLNAIALMPPLVFTRAWRNLALWTLLAAPALSMALLQFSTFDEYRGASGLVMCLWAFVTVELFRRGQQRLALVMSAAIALKLLLEMSDALPWSAGVESSHAAHYLGAALGVLGGVFGVLGGAFGRSASRPSTLP